jgi:hypothetical protein
VTFQGHQLKPACLPTMGNVISTFLRVHNQVLNYTCPPVPYWEKNDQIDPYLSQMMIEPFVVYSSCLTTIMTISESD